MANERGWQSKDILTWIILIWGFSRLSAPSNVFAGNAGCAVPANTQTGFDIPPWVQGVGQTFTIEGEQ